MPVETRPAPDYLAAAGRRLWDEIAGSGRYSLGPHHFRQLEDACREADLIDRLEGELRDGPLMVEGSQGQLVASPLVSELRQHRTAFGGILSRLPLPVEPGESQADAAKRERSEQARKAAKARWDRPKLSAVQ